MCHPAAPIEMKRRSMLVHRVRRVPPPKASSFHRMSKPPQLYSSTVGASARVTVVSVTCGVGQVSDENERPLVSVLSDLRPAGRTRCILLAIGHFLLLEARRQAGGPSAYRP